MQALMALPIVGYCVHCAKLKLKQLFRNRKRVS